jgi:two-component system, chemotaxis family, chemotaxis protein CheY
MSTATATSPQTPTRPRVLIVDDSPTIREQLASALRARGYTTVEAGEGVEGLWRARSQVFEVVLTDVHMPSMDGLEFVRELRKLPGYRQVPVFVLTSDASRARFVEGRQVGANGWFLKPPNFDALDRALREALANP